jgi:hypothetical protein
MESYFSEPATAFVRGRLHNPAASINDGLAAGLDLLSTLSGRPVWDCYSELDDILGSLAADADNRLAWQGEFDTKHPGAR